jgi:hypothetical protein
MTFARPYRNRCQSVERATPVRESVDHIDDSGLVIGMMLAVALLRAAELSGVSSPADRQLKYLQ